VDGDPDAIADVRRLAATIAPGLPADRFAVSSLENLPFADSQFSVVICSAVLHFARSGVHFEAMLRSLWRVLAPGGMFFARLASSAGIEDQIRPLGEGRHVLPDGTVRFLVDERVLAEWASALGGKLLDPLKTTIVHGQRSMATWVLRKD
jgi:SAM-dependent methyltransferase